MTTVDFRNKIYYTPPCSISFFFFFLNCGLDFLLSRLVLQTEFNLEEFTFHLDQQ